MVVSLLVVLIVSVLLVRWIGLVLLVWLKVSMFYLFVSFDSVWVCFGKSMVVCSGGLFWCVMCVMMILVVVIMNLELVVLLSV